MVMKSTLTAIGGILLFLAGVMAGGVLPRTVKAQTPTENEQNVQWVVVPMERNNFRNFDGYIYNPHTGEAFMLHDSNKTQVKAKQ